jgi:hypothetical protein
VNWSSCAPVLYVPFHHRLTTSLLTLNNALSIPGYDDTTRTNPTPLYFVTASEDTTIKLYRHDVKSNTLACITTLTDHSDIVRCMSISSLSGGRCLLFSGGGKEHVTCHGITYQNNNDGGIAVESLTSIGGSQRREGVKWWLQHDGGHHQRMINMDVRVMCITSFLITTRYRCVSYGTSAGVIMVMTFTHTPMFFVVWLVFDRMSWGLDLLV